MRDEDDDLFDAKLRAALRAPEAAAAAGLPAGPPPARGVPLAVIVTVAASLFVLVGLFVLTSTGGGESTATLPDAQGRDPQGRGRADAPRPSVPLPDLVGELRIRRKRGAALAELARRGEVGAVAIAKHVASLDPNEPKQLEVIEACLQTYGSMALATKSSALSLRELLDDWPAAGVTAVVGALGEIAPWVYVQVPMGSISFMEIGVADRKIPCGKAEIVNRFFVVARRYMDRSRLRGRKTAAELRKNLVGKSALRREAVLDLLLRASSLDAVLHADLEKLFLESQPKISKPRWVDPRSVETHDEDSGPLLRRKAADVLLRLAPTSSAATTAYAWTVRSKHVAARLRQRAAMTLGQVEVRGEDRSKYVLESLLIALGDDNPKVVSEAVSTLPRLGKPALRAFARVEGLTKHPDRGVAGRAKAALAQLRALTR